MGIKNLWDLLKPIGKPTDLEHLRGKTLAVDISFWFHEAKFAAERQGVSHERATLELVYRRVVKLLHFGIRPVIVFDALQTSIFKLPTLNARRVQREKQAEAKAERCQNRALKNLARRALTVQLARETGNKRPLVPPVDEEALIKEKRIRDELADIPPEIFIDSSSDDEPTSSQSTSDEFQLPSSLAKYIDNSSQEQSIDVVFGGADYAHVLIHSGSSPTKRESIDPLRRREAIEKIRQLAASEGHVSFYNTRKESREIFIQDEITSDSDDDVKEVSAAEAPSISKSAVPKKTVDVSNARSSKTTVQKWQAKDDSPTKPASQTDMLERCKQLLDLFGVPYVESPSEAEAQCVQLEISGLSDGTISDDSDVWAFGGRTMYRHMFDRRKSVLEYKSEDIVQILGLEKLHFVAIALMLGCDFTPGITNLGTVAALEILSEFVQRPQTTQQMLDQLTNFGDWWRSSHVEKGKPEPPEPNPTRRRLRGLDFLFPPAFPDTTVVELFTKPNVNGEIQELPSTMPQFDALREFLIQELGDSTKIQGELFDLRRRLKPPDESQRKLTSFYPSTNRPPLSPSNISSSMSGRLRKAVEKLRKAAST